MKTEYGVIVLWGVRKDWVAQDWSGHRARLMLVGYGIPGEWGDSTVCVLWRDRFHRTRAIVAVYPNNRTAIIRIDANGKWRTTFGDVE